MSRKNCLQMQIFDIDMTGILRKNTSFWNAKILFLFLDFHYPVSSIINSFRDRLQILLLIWSEFNQIY